MAMAAALIALMNATRRIQAEYTITVSGNYATGGDTLNLTTATNLTAVPYEGPIEVPAVPPKLFEVNCGGYYAQLKTPSPANLSSYLIQWFTPGGAEVAAGAYPAAILAGQLTMELSVTKGR